MVPGAQEPGSGNAGQHPWASPLRLEETPSLEVRGAQGDQLAQALQSHVGKPRACLSPQWEGDKGQLSSSLPAALSSSKRNTRNKEDDFPHTADNECSDSQPLRASNPSVPGQEIYSLPLTLLKGPGGGVSPCWFLCRQRWPVNPTTSVLAVLSFQWLRQGPSALASAGLVSEDGAQGLPSSVWRVGGSGGMSLGKGSPSSAFLFYV